MDRADRVIKRLGVRISLVELGEAMGGLDGVSAAACVAFDDDGQLGIAAFVVADRPASVLDLRRAAGELLPESMLPDRIEMVDSLPLTPSSKLDERRLLAQVGLGEGGCRTGLLVPDSGIGRRSLPAGPLASAQVQCAETGDPGHGG